MADTLNNLYLKYLNKVARALESDRYYKYLFDLIMAGNNTITQSNHILHKKVDERWLSMIESSFDAIETIIAKPRRYIAQDEQLVPVDLARKITADSVRHLAQNTQNIAGIDEDNNIMPSKILNVTSRESYDLYENRFVYSLITKLVNFIDKRTDIIFWSTGDECTSVLEMESHIDDTYEQIDYKVEMKVKNKQSYLETDSQHMEVFKRIDRVRRVVLEFQRSSFYQLMEGSAAIRSPIQRTNLLTKDPYYRKCYELWQFLEKYDDVGYSIEARDVALEFDEEYLIQLYTNMITNYTVFKSILDTDQRNLDEAKPIRKRQLKPKFVKKIVEQIVDDYDIPDVEIKKVIIEEITKAQLEIEKKKALREKELEKEKEKAAKQAEAEKARIAREKEKEKAAKQAELEKARLAKEKEKARKAKEKEREKEKALKAKQAELEKARLAKEKEKARKAKEKEREKEKVLKAKQAEAEKARKAKEKEKEKALKVKQAELEKARKAKEKAKGKAGGKKAVAVVENTASPDTETVTKEKDNEK